MNLAKINEIRNNAGLPALAVNPKAADAKKRQAANQAIRAQASREMKAKRASRGK